MITKEQALYSLSQHSELSEICELLPVQTEFLIDLALTCNVSLWRRNDFALLKLYATRLAWTTSNHPQLRTKRHEEALHAFIDWLLPDEPIGEMEAVS